MELIRLFTSTQMVHVASNRIRVEGNDFDFTFGHFVNKYNNNLNLFF